MNTIRFMLGLLLVSLSSAALAQGTITSASANYVVGPTPWDITPGADFTGVGTGDQVFEAGWFFRIEGDAQESFFPAPDTQDYVGDTATITWVNIGGRNLAVVKTLVISSAAADQGETISEVAVTNNTGAEITLHLFHAVDFDVNGSAGADSATLVTPNSLMQVTDATQGMCEYRGVSAVNYAVRAWNSSTDVFALLNDASVGDLDNTGLPFGPGDFTGAYQWTQVLADGATMTVRAHMACNTMTTPVELQSFEVN